MPERTLVSEPCRCTGKDGALVFYCSCRTAAARGSGHLLPAGRSGSMADVSAAAILLAIVRFRITTDEEQKKLRAKRHDAIVHPIKPRRAGPRPPWTRWATLE